jgi:hypothetical protein
VGNVAHSGIIVEHAEFIVNEVTPKILFKFKKPYSIAWDVGRMLDLAGRMAENLSFASRSKPRDRG